MKGRPIGSWLAYGGWTVTGIVTISAAAFLISLV
jgi:hypothetical protein